MHFSKEHVVKLLSRISSFASINLESLSSLGLDMADEIDRTLLGLIVRQHSLTTDLATILLNKKSVSFTSELVLFRCIIDDYIHFTYIFNQSDLREEILNLNGDAITKNFNKIVELAAFNEEKLGGNYPHYPTSDLLNQIREKIKATPNRQQYILDKELFKLRSFKSTGNLIRSLSDSDYMHDLVRAYFTWRKYSDFVHYSVFSYDEERQLNPLVDDTFTEFAEIIFYSYQTVLNSLNYFHGKYQFEIIDKDDLADYYKDAGRHEG